MRYRTIGTDTATQRSVSVLSLGAMLMGSRTDEATSFAILGRFVEAGGTSHAGTRRRLAALSAVASETGATANQVVLAWLMGGELPVIPLVGASSVEQLEESLGAVDLTLTTEQRARLDQAG